MKSRTAAGKKSWVHHFEQERWLYLTGLFGFLLAGICAVWVLLFGGEVAPRGDVSKAISFNAALGIFLLSTAAIMPFAAMGKRSKVFFRITYIILVLYSYGAETVQNFRGVNPRFVHNGTIFDKSVGNIFAFVALMLVLSYLFLAVHYFRRKAYVRRPEIVVGIRYAMVATVISFATGVWISVNQGRFTGLEGNIIWLHGLGFHALQAVPIVARLTEYTSLKSTVRRTMVHITGIAYVLGLIAIGVLTWNGHSVLEWSALQVVAIVSFLVSITAGAWVLGQSVTELRRTYKGYGFEGLILMMK